MNIREIAKDLGLEEEEYLELLELFIETSNSDLNMLQAAIEAGDAKIAENAVHSFKGAASNLGLMEFHKAANDIKVEAINGRLRGIAEFAQVLKNKLDVIEEFVRSKKT